MREVAFRLTQAGLTAYQYAVADRLKARKRQGLLQQPAVLWVALTGSMMLAMLAGTSAIERYLDRPVETPEFLLGLVLGFLAMLATVWAYYLDQRRGLAREDGPILSPQTMRLTADGIEVQSQTYDVRYRWPVVEAISEARGLVILWIEPGAGLAVPADAFESAAARAQFIAEAEAFRSAAAQQTAA